MQLDSFDYETIQQNQEETNLRNIRSMISPNKYARRIKLKLLNCIKKIQTYSLHIIILSLIIGNLFFAILSRQCAENNEQACFKHFILENIANTITKVAFSSLIFALLLWLTLVDIISRKYLLIVSANLVLVLKIFYQEESLYNYSKLYNILLCLLTLLMFVLLYGIHILYWVLSRINSKKKFLSLIIIVSLTLLSSYIIFLRIVKTSSTWGDGVVGRKITDKTSDGQKLCNIQKPEKDWYHLVGSLQDLSKNYYDCTKHAFIEFERSREVLKQNVFEFGQLRYLAYPRLQDIDYTYNRSYTQEFIYKNILQVDNINDIPQETEYVLDTESLIYTIDVKRNESLIKTRALKREALLAKMKIEGRQLPKNIIVLYIDALSRMRLPIKLPKVFAWFEDYQKKHQQTMGTFQGMRAVSVAAFTWHNMLAYFFGVQSNNENIYENSPYTLLEKATITKNVSTFNENLGRNVTKKVLAADIVYDSFVQDFKDAGYVTALTNTDCATNPITQESISNVSYLKPIVYDHMGMVHACDPNYFAPQDINNLGQGPYSIFRRCLYGREMIDYSVEYAQQFMTKYKDQPKFLEMEFIEAHEGTGEVITHMDDKLYKNLVWMEQHAHVIKTKILKLEDSVFIFLSDHGMHLNNLLAAFKAEIMYTEIGLPIQILLYSKQLFKEADLKSLQKNQQKMTTMYEIYYFYKFLVSVDKASYFRDNSIISEKIPASRSSFDLPMFDGLPLVCKKPTKKLM